MQDYKLARLIGTTTFGKGSVQEITSYYDNSSLKLTIAKWLTPLQRDINHHGLVPDQIVSISDFQRQSGLDPQLDAAIAYLN
jgi:carboxyl-terminal processing protease